MGPALLEHAQHFPREPNECDKGRNTHAGRQPVAAIAPMSCTLAPGYPAYESLFGPVSSEHLAGGGRDFSVFDELLPHPVYARQRWLCILNPTPETFERAVWPLLVDAHRTAVSRYRRRGGQ
jgi:hypothetical protein